MHVHPDETVRSAIAILQEYGVSQMPVVKAEPPLALAEVVGTVTDRGLLERLVADPAAIDTPVEAVMDPPLPMIGSGEPVDVAAARLADSAAVLVLDGGHPTGIVTRSDLLDFLAGSGPADVGGAGRIRPSRSMAEPVTAGRTSQPVVMAATPGTGRSTVRRAERTRPVTGPRRPMAGGTASRPGPSTPARTPTRPPGRSSRRSRWRRPSPRRRSASTGATSTPAAATRPGPPSKPCLASLEGAAHGLAFASGLAAEDAVLRLLRPATT